MLRPALAFLHAGKSYRRPPNSSPKFAPSYELLSRRSAASRKIHRHTHRPPYNRFGVQLDRIQRRLRRPNKGYRSPRKAPTCWQPAFPCPQPRASFPQLSEPKNRASHQRPVFALNKKYSDPVLAGHAFRTASEAVELAKTTPEYGPRRAWSVEKPINVQFSTSPRKSKSRPVSMEVQTCTNLLRDAAVAAFRAAIAGGKSGLRGREGGRRRALKKILEPPLGAKHAHQTPTPVRLPSITSNDPGFCSLHLENGTKRRGRTPAPLLRNSTPPNRTPHGQKTPSSPANKAPPRLRLQGHASPRRPDGRLPRGKLSPDLPRAKTLAKRPSEKPTQSPAWPKVHRPHPRPSPILPMRPKKSLPNGRDENPRRPSFPDVRW